jgi:Flp pilus assembly secretin CpaC
MRKRTLALIVLLCAVTFAAGGGAAEPKEFGARMVMTEMRNGKPVVWAEPTLVARDGQRASFLAGGEVPVDLGKIEYIEFGTRADITVHEIAAGRLSVCAWFNVSTLDTSTPGSIVIPESGVRIIKTINPGDFLEADLPGGRHVKVTVTRRN